jgi:endonuclease/exonuclease/phosphatase family metal-dependent hydrolase
VENPKAPQRLRLLSYNIQSGLTTNRYSHYVTGGWKHVVPVPSRMRNLERIASLISRYDVVGLQEVDAGSLRSGFVDQAHYLADRGRFGHFYEQTNRQIGRISRHSNVFLGRIRPDSIREHRLPGVIGGRGALMIRFGKAEDDVCLHLCIVHLALSRRARRVQMAYLAERINTRQHLVLMGDLNCASDSKDMCWFRETANLVEPIHGLRTFPSWNPRRQLDHILVSPSLMVEQLEVLSYRYSDHLPIAMDLHIPEGLDLASREHGSTQTTARHWVR